MIENKDISHTSTRNSSQMMTWICIVAFESRLEKDPQISHTHTRVKSVSEGFKGWPTGTKQMLDPYSSSRLFTQALARVSLASVNIRLRAPHRTEGKLDRGQHNLLSPLFGLMRFPTNLLSPSPRSHKIYCLLRATLYFSRTRIRLIATCAG